jgi:hypothetical protein
VGGFLPAGHTRGEAASAFERWQQAALRAYVGWLSVATIANTSAALIALRWDGWGIAPQVWAVIMLVVATGVAWVVGRVVNDDNVYRAVFVLAFMGIVVQQWDVPIIVWTAAGGGLAIAGMIAATWRRRARQLPVAA